MVAADPEFDDLAGMGKKGWHSRGYLPHYDGYDISQHVVFRLHDSVPAGLRSGDDVLDRGLGCAVLRQAACADHVIGALVHGDGVLGRRGRLWAADYFDRYIRDQTHFETTKRYIEMNPVVAGLCDRPEKWPFSSVSAA